MISSGANLYGERGAHKIGSSARHIALRTESLASAKDAGHAVSDPCTRHTHRAAGPRTGKDPGQVEARDALAAGADATTRPPDLLEIVDLPYQGARGCVVAFLAIVILLGCWSAWKCKRRLCLARRGSVYQALLKRSSLERVAFVARKLV